MNIRRHLPYEGMSRRDAVGGKLVRCCLDTVVMLYKAARAVRNDTLKGTVDTPLRIYGALRIKTASAQRKTQFVSSTQSYHMIP